MTNTVYGNRSGRERLLHAFGFHLFEDGVLLEIKPFFKKMPLKNLTQKTSQYLGILTLDQC